MLKIRAAAIAVAFAAVAFPATAQAKGMGPCVARSFPADARAEVIAAYAKGGVDGLKGQPTEGVLKVLVGACQNEGVGASADYGRQFGKAVAGHVLRTGAEASLNSRRSISSATLDRAWASLTDQERKDFATDGNGDGPSTELVLKFVRLVRPDISRETLVRLDQDSNLPPEIEALKPVVSDLIMYSVGRGTLEEVPTS